MAAPLVSLATNSSVLFVVSVRFQVKMYSPSPAFSRIELLGSSPSSFSVKLSPGSMTFITKTDFFPKLTWKVILAVILGGKFSEK